jgi:hypothetical protein
MSHMHWVARQNKLELPNDEEEVNTRDIHKCDGQAHDPAWNHSHTIFSTGVVYYESILYLDTTHWYYFKDLFSVLCCPLYHWRPYVGISRIKNYKGRCLLQAVGKSEAEKTSSLAIFSSSCRKNTWSLRRRGGSSYQKEVITFRKGIYLGLFTG